MEDSQEEEYASSSVALDSRDEQDVSSIQGSCPTVSVDIDWDEGSYTMELYKIKAQYSLGQYAPFNEFQLKFCFMVNVGWLERH